MVQFVSVCFFISRIPNFAKPTETDFRATWWKGIARAKEKPIEVWIHDSTFRIPGFTLAYIEKYSICPWWKSALDNQTRHKM